MGTAEITGQVLGVGRHRRPSNAARAANAGLVLAASALLGAAIAMPTGTDSTAVTGPVWAGASFCYDFPLRFGVDAGIDLPLRYKTDSLFKRNGTIATHRSAIFVSARLEYSRYVLNSRDLWLHADIGLCRFSRKTFFGGGLFGIGVERTFYEGTDYVVDNGTITTVPLAGRFYATTALTGLLGWDLERLRKPLPVSIRAKPSLWVAYPYNDFVLPHLSLTVEALYHLPSWNARVHAVTKTRRQR